MSAFTCPKCGAVSHNPNDLEHAYCGRCGIFVHDEIAKAAATVGNAIGLALGLEAWVIKALLESDRFTFKEELRAIARMRDQIWEGGEGETPLYLLPSFAEADAAIANQVEAGKVPKAAALVVFAAIRDAARVRSPKLAELLIPHATESADPGSKR